MLRSLFLLFLFLSINISITAQSKETKYVSSNGGLNLRNAPNTDGKKIKLIPQGESVIILSEQKEEVEVSGKKGYWTEVESEGKRGWVFGAFLIANPIPDFTINYLNGKSFETAKISAPFKITFMQGNPNLFTGQCDDGHYGGGKMEGEWSLASNNSIIISGSLERHSYQEIEKVSVTKFPKHKLEFRFKDNEYQIYNYLDTKGKTILTPCDTKIKNGVWYSSLGQEVNFWEAGK